MTCFLQVKEINEGPVLTRETFVPRASTPLLNAIRRGINDLEQSLSEIGEGANPKRFEMVIITNGQGNASKDFRLPGCAQQGCFLYRRK